MRGRTAGRGVVQHLAQLTALAAAGVVAWLTSCYGWHPAWGHRFFDLRVYRSAVRWWLLQHHELYVFHYHRTKLGFTYPPFAGLVLSPLAPLSVAGAVALITAVSSVVLVLTTWQLLAPVARRHGWPVPFVVAVAVPLAFAMEPVRETYSYGQVNLVLAGLVLADLAALQKGRRWAGVGIGLATAIKLTPALFIPYLLLSRRFRAAGVAAGSVVVAGLVAFAVAPHASLRFWGSTLWDTSRVGPPSATENQSLLGLLARFAAPGPASTVLWLLLCALVLVVGLRRAVRAAAAGDELTGITLTGLTSCLLSPISWTHHLYWVVPAVVVLVDRAAGTPAAGTPAGQRQRARWPAGLAAAAVYAVFAVSVIWAFGDVPEHWVVPPVAGAIGASGYVLVLLALLLLLPARRVRTAAPSAARTTARPRPAGSSPR